MPIIESPYQIKGLHSSMHFTTIFNNRLRRIDVSWDKRERIELPDGDFLDVDWKFTSEKADKIIVCLHGLEGSSASKYMLGMAKHGSERGYDVLGVNYRGCSGEPNRLFRTYHAGATEDLEAILNRVVSKNQYKSIYIKGFSLGGNLLMFYLGKNENIPKEIKAAMAVSSPNYLKACSDCQAKRENFLYAKNFLATMKKKLRQKQEQFPGLVSEKDFKKIKTLTDFDQVYTAKAHGFKDADDYYDKCSSAFVMDNIKIPTLLLNAQNDSFLSHKCYPREQAKNNPNFFLEAPKLGGHLGFYYNKKMTYNEKRAFDFFDER